MNNNDTQILKIYEINAGSRAYGTNIEGSDEDRRGIFCLDKKTVSTQFGYFDEIDEKDPFDSKLFELRKFVHLLQKQNPNIIELLWTRREDMVHCSPAMEPLLAARGKLLSKEVATTYLEYAVSQMKRIKGHNKMIANPQPEAAPMIKNFVKIKYNLTDNSAFNSHMPEKGFVLYNHSGSGVLAFNEDKFKSVFPQMNSNTDCFDSFGVPKIRERAELQKIQKLGIKPDIMLEINMAEYKSAHEQWKNYWTWVNNRNPARSDLEHKFGYDTKHAMHTVRLMRIGLEILERGEVLVFRPDAQELKQIRAGSLKYEQLLEMCQETEQKINSSLLKSELPETIDMDLVRDLCFETYEAAWREMSPIPARTGDIRRSPL